MNCRLCGNETNSTSGVCWECATKREATLVSFRIKTNGEIVIKVNAKIYQDKKFFLDLVAEIDRWAKFQKENVDETFDNLSPKLKSNQ